MLSGRLCGKAAIEKLILIEKLMKKYRVLLNPFVRCRPVSLLRKIEVHRLSLCQGRSALRKSFLNILRCCF